MTCGCGCGCGGGGRGGGDPCAVLDTCGCCEGVMPITPLTIINRPGLSRLDYRVGTHGTFLATMLARLSSTDFPALAGLRVRAESDPSIALLDCWATIADVLTFYQEQIANEGYLRTATERFSILELAQLVGYTLRPGLGASAYLAYTLERNPAKVTAVTIPKGAQAMSVPGPGQQPQTFETSADLAAEEPFNTLAIRATRPPAITQQDVADATTAAPLQLHLEGATLSIKAGDRFVLVFDDGDGGSAAAPAIVQTVTADAAAGTTTVSLVPDPIPASTSASVSRPAGRGAGDASGNGGDHDPSDLNGLGDVLGPLGVPPSVPPSDPAHLVRDPKTLFATKSDVWPQALVQLQPRFGQGLYSAWAQLPSPTAPALQEADAQRVKAGVFGATAPLMPITDGHGAVIGTTEWPLAGGEITLKVEVTPQGAGQEPTVTATATDPAGRSVSLSHAAGDWTGVENAPLLSADATRNVSVAVSGPVAAEVGDEPAIAGAAAAIFDTSLTFSGSVAATTIEVSGDDDLKQTTANVHGDGYSPAANQTLPVTKGNAFVTLSGATPPTLTVVDLEPSAPLPNILDLDAEYNQVVVGSWAIVERVDTGAVITAHVTAVETIARADYNLTGKVTRLTLDTNWLTPSDVSLSVARNTTVYVQSDPQTVAPVPDASPVPDPAGQTLDTLELDGLFGGLETGRLLIITGERANLPGVTAGEPIMVAAVTQHADPTVPGDTVHTTVTLATPLAFSYVRSTITIWGNVVQATQGADQHDVLGSGAASQPNQPFPLSRGPLTYLPAPTPAGAQSTLDVKVDGVSWSQVDYLLGLGPRDRGFVTETDDTSKTTVRFGDGVNGARLPTGAANVTADYRVGLGVSGNAKIGQISQPQTRPQGVQGVTNPLAASGGADPDTVDQGRANAPIGVMSLDRLVSVEDYEEFARAWAGIGKASSVLLSHDQGQFVHLSLGGTTADPLDSTSALVTNLELSLVEYGDPQIPVQVAACDVALIVLAAHVHIDSAYDWTSVEASARSALLSKYSYANRDLGEDVVRSDIVATIQAVAGVDYAIVTSLGVLGAATVDEINKVAGQLSDDPPVRIRSGFAGFSGEPSQLHPASVAILSPDLPDMLVLAQITP